MRAPIGESDISSQLMLVPVTFQITVQKKLHYPGKLLTP
jgi:hypothetical protein